MSGELPDGGADRPLRPPGPDRPRRLVGPMVIVTVVAVAAAALAVLFTVLVNRPDHPIVTDAASSTLEPSVSTGSRTPKQSVETTAEPPSPSPSRSAPPVTNPEEPPSKDGANARVVRNTAGEPCRRRSSPSDYGDYPAATCRFWQRPVGLLTGEPADTGKAEVACQRDLRRKNPKYAQTNTWWVWTRSAYGTWDWFPETAIEEGAADKPLSGVALCR